MDLLLYAKVLNERVWVRNEEEQQQSTELTTAWEEVCIFLRVGGSCS